MAKTSITPNHIPADLAGTDPKFYIELFQQGSMLHALLDKLLVDHTTKKNIVWGTDSYLELGEDFAPKKQMTKDQCLQLIHDNILIPRVQKSKQDQKDRTKKKAEVFTPTWIVNYMVDAVDNMWFDREDVFNVEDNDTHTWVSVKEKVVFPNTPNHTWKDYVSEKRLEITCGEAPYLVSRYDVTTGEPIPVSERVGVLDRKLRIVSENTESESDWLVWARKAFCATHGFEWQGDNLFFARINLLLTFIDYYRDKFGKDPSLAETRKTARVIAWNVWQMDGLKDIPPYGVPEDIVDSNEISADEEQEKLFMPPKGKRAEAQFNEEGTPYCVLRDWRGNTYYTYHGLKKDTENLSSTKKTKKSFKELSCESIQKTAEAAVKEASTADTRNTDVYDGFLNLDGIREEVVREEKISEEDCKEENHTEENSGRNEGMPILGSSDLEILPISGCSEDPEEKRKEKTEEMVKEMTEEKAGEKTQKDISAIFENTEENKEIPAKSAREISNIFLSVGTLFSHVYTDRNAAAKDTEDSYPVSVWSEKGFWLYEGMSDECPEDVKKMEAVRMYIDWGIKKVAITAKG